MKKKPNLAASTLASMRWDKTPLEERKKVAKMLVESRQNKKVAKSKDETSSHNSGEKQKEVE